MINILSYLHLLQITIPNYNPLMKNNYNTITINYKTITKTITISNYNTFWLIIIPAHNTIWEK